MHPFRVALVLAVAIPLLGGAALADAMKIESTPVPASPKPNFSKMMFLTGDWTCSVLSSRRPGPYTTTSTTAVSPDGYWMVTQTTIHKASWIPTQFTSEDRVTYDASTSRWVDLTYGQGGGYDLSTSPGWNGNAIVWTDVAYPKVNATATNNPTTLTKVSESKTSSMSTFKEPSGRVVTVHTTCTKS